MLGRIMSEFASQLTPVFISFYLRGFFYGIYSGIFAMYLHHYLQSDRRTTLIFYSLCTLYILSIVLIASELTFSHLPPAQDATWNYNFYVIEVVISGCCDFIAQSILIYRCWIVWNRNIHVVIIPSILAFIFLGVWVAGCGSFVYVPSAGHVFSANWANTLFETSLAMSLTVNALVTSLIVFKIFKVYSETKPLYTRTFGPSGGSKLRPILFVIIESGMALFAIQLARLVASILQTIETQLLIVGIHEMLNGITPTIIQVRVSMGLSFHDQPSLEEVTSGLHFGSDQGRRNSISGTGSHGIVDEDDDGIGIQHLGSNDIVHQIVGIQPSNDDSDIIEVQRDGL